MLSKPTLSTTCITSALTYTTTTTTTTITQTLPHLQQWRHPPQCAVSSWAWWCQTVEKEGGIPCCPVCPCFLSPPSPWASPSAQLAGTSHSLLAMAAFPCRPLQKKGTWLWTDCGQLNRITLHHLPRSLVLYLTLKILLSQLLTY